MLKDLKIRTKLIFSLLLVAILPLVAILAVLYHDTKSRLLETSLVEESVDLLAKKEGVDLLLMDIKSEVLFLSNLYSLNDFINTDDIEAKEKDLEKLRHNFLVFSQEKGIYYQLRYLDADGQEVVRVDNKDGRSYVVPEDQLQNKKGRYYFDDAIKIAKREVFVSPLDLNIENGELENRGTAEEPAYVPVIRYATPVFNDNGDFKGVVIANVYADNFLNSLEQVIVGESHGKENYLINQDGYFLYHSDKEKSWGFMFDNDETVYKYYTQADKLLSEKQGQFYSTTQHSFLTFSRIYPSDNQAYLDGASKEWGDGYYWVLISQVSKDVVYGSVNEVLYKILLLIIIVLVIIIFFALLLSNSIAKPIIKLIEGVKIIKEGNLNYKVGLNQNDEIGWLSKDFDEMTASIKESRSEIDRKVKTQTKEIVSKSKEMENQQAAILNILEDVEEEKHKVDSLAKDLEKFKLAVDNAYSHIVITDHDGICIYANKAVEMITGFSRKEILGKKVGTKDNWGGLMEPAFYQKLWRTIKVEKKSFSGHVKNKRKDGRNYDSFAVISPVLDKGRQVKFFVGIERDVTKEKEIDRAKSEFVSLASHQLRTPLSTINWYAEMLLAGDAGKINKEQKEYLQEVYKGNQRMVDLVNALLNVSRIELGTLAVEPEPTDLIDLANSVLNEIKPQIEQRKQKIVRTFGKNIPKINLDPKLMRIVFQNYISNAMKYTPEKGRIEIGIKKQKTEVLLSVKDNGMGIPKYQQVNIFTKLFRADNVREKETDGTGLGLYIVKSVIEQFGGKVWFESVESKGTTFFATIPIKGVEAKEGSKGLEYTK